MGKRIVITGLGCLSPVGSTVSETWANIQAGRSGGGRITYYDPSIYECQIAAQVKEFDGASLLGTKEARRMDRCSQYALFAAKQAIADSGLEVTDNNRDRIGVILGTGIGGMGTLFEQFQVFFERGPSRVSPFMVPMMLPDTPAGMIAIHFGLRGNNMAVVAACASGTNAIGEAAEVIRRGHADVILGGGTEAAIIPIAMAGLASMGALSKRNDDPEHASRPFDRTRDGFLMGEGASVLVLESLEHAQARGARILGEMVGYGCTNDAFHISAPAENGAGAAQCMRQALDRAGLEIYDIDYINAHGTSTPLNDRTETSAIKTVFGEHAYNIPVSSTKSMTGHLLGAAGALEAVLSLQVIQDGVIPPTINYHHPDPECDLDYVPNVARSAQVDCVMSNSFGFGGHNATIILNRFIESPL
jgi:3-oxoacyl-[acyl-carrier-protein] synthase II